MRLEVLLFPLVAAAFARPEAGYDYNPTNSIQPSITYASGQATSTLITEPSTSYLPGGTNIYGSDIGTNHNLHQDQTSVYFYAAPDDEQPSPFRIYVEPASARNTKVIFIKAPGHGGILPEVIAPPSVAEDKTLVYVLSKHQQQGGSITIPSSLGVKYVKPEVHFVRYRNHHDAESAVSRGLYGQRVGVALEDLGNPYVFTRNLGWRDENRNLGWRGGDRNLGWRGGDQTGITSITGITNPTIDTRYGPSGNSGPYYK